MLHNKIYTGRPEGPISGHMVDSRVAAATCGLKKDRQRVVRWRLTCVIGMNAYIFFFFLHIKVCEDIKVELEYIVVYAHSYRGFQAYLTSV